VVGAPFCIYCLFEEDFESLVLIPPYILVYSSSAVIKLFVKDEVILYIHISMKDPCVATFTYVLLDEMWYKCRTLDFVPFRICK
jgi:hypothetical protein